MFHFEIELAKFFKEMQAEQEAKAKQQAAAERLNQSKLADDFLRNHGETKAQAADLGKRDQR